MIQNLRAIVLSKRTFTENDLIVTVLSEQGEKLELVAKGAAGPQSKRRAHLELMNEVQLTIRDGRAHLYLDSVTCVNSFSSLKNSLESIFHAQVLLNLVERSLAPQNPEPQLFTLLHQTLSALSQKTPYALTLEISMLQLAHTLGVLPSFKHCGKCLRALQENAAWNPEHNTLHCHGCKHPDAETLELKYLKALEFFRSATHTDYRRLHLAPDEELALRTFIRRFCESHFAQPLKALEWA